MVKTNSAWLRRLLRAGTRQQRAATKVVKTLLKAAKPKAKATPKPKVKASKTTAKPRATAKTTLKPKVMASVKTTLKPKARPIQLARLFGPEAAAPSQLPCVAPPGGKWLASHFAALSGHGVMQRMSYWLYLPQRARVEMPLVVMLHGCDQSATQMAQGARMNQLAERAGVAVLYPQQSLRAHPHRCWKWYERATQHGGGDVRLITAIIDKVTRQYGFDRRRIYIGGISAGAAMAHIVALNHPQLIAAVGLHSSPIFGAGHSPINALSVMQHGASGRAEEAIAELLARHPAFPPMPTILIQGDGDKVVRPVNQVQLARQVLLLNRMPADSLVSSPPKLATTRSHGYQLRDASRGRTLLLRSVLIEQLGHAWSGGDASLKFNSSKGPTASKMMLEFFARHQRTTSAPR